MEIQWLEVWSKNRSKIDVKNDAETERLGNSILIDFWSIWDPSWPSKTEPRRSKIDVEKASKIAHSSKAPWNTVFSAKNAKDAPQMVKFESALRSAGRLGEDLGGGRQEPLRTLALGGWLWKDLEALAELGPAIQHAVPRWAADRFAHSAGPLKSEWRIAYYLQI